MTTPNDPLLERLAKLDELSSTIEKIRLEIAQQISDRAEPDPRSNPVAKLSRLRGAVANPQVEEKTYEVDGLIVGSAPEPESRAWSAALDHAEESHLPFADATWRDMMLKPGMAAAMMFSLYEVIQAAIDGKYNSLDALVRDLRIWDSMTVAETVALTELFAWVEAEVSRGDESFIPPPLRANMQRAYSNYQEGS